MQLSESLRIIAEEITWDEVAGNHRGYTEDGYAVAEYAFKRAETLFACLRRSVGLPVPKTLLRLLNTPRGVYLQDLTR